MQGCQQASQYWCHRKYRLSWLFNFPISFDSSNLNSFAGFLKTFKILLWREATVPSQQHKMKMSPQWQHQPFSFVRVLEPFPLLALPLPLFLQVLSGEAWCSYFKIIVEASIFLHRTTWRIRSRDSQALGIHTMKGKIWCMTGTWCLELKTAVNSHMDLFGISDDAWLCVWVQTKETREELSTLTTHGISCNLSCIVFAKSFMFHPQIRNEEYKTFNASSKYV